MFEELITNLLMRIEIQSRINTGTREMFWRLHLREETLNEIKSSMGASNRRAKNAKKIENFEIECNEWN